MSDCPTCGVSFDCFDPATLYSLQSVTYPFVTVCPTGQVCDIGSDFHLICCQEDVHIVFPPGFSLEQKQQVIAGAVAECQRQAAFCNELPPPCPTPPCTLTLYWNRSQTCTANCPDGVPYSYTIGPGRWLGTTQLMADTFAHQEACRLAKTHLICLSSLSGAHCADEATELTITAKGGFLAVYPQADFWEVISGDIPTGMTFQGGYRTDRMCVIDGTPTTAGEYTFTVRVTCWTVGSPGFGDYTEKSYTVKIVGISPATLPDATIGEAYLENLSVSPTHDQETEVWTLVTSLPDGLELSEAGVISGTPTGPAESHDVTVSVTFTLDGEEVTCEQEYTLEVMAAYDDITPDITSATPVCFAGDTPAGTYRIGYVSGALNYANNLNLWNVNNVLLTGYYIKFDGGASQEYFSELTTGAYATQALAEAANAGVTHDIVHAGGTICMFLDDSPYGDNHPGIPNPTFSLTRIA